MNPEIKSFKRLRSNLILIVLEGNNDSDCELDLSLDDYNLPTALPSDYRSLETKEETKLMTRRQADLFIARQANLIQHSEGHALSPLELQRELNVIVKTNPGIEFIIVIKLS